MKTIAEALQRRALGNKSKEKVTAAVRRDVAQVTGSELLEQIRQDALGFETRMMKQIAPSRLKGE